MNIRAPKEIVAGFVDPTPKARESQPWRSNATRVFGYDVFISFALGAPPRGTQAYGSDLARRLRERNFTVFYSEDVALPGTPLAKTIAKALARSRSMVVIANDGTLLDPRWVRTEAQQYKSLRPKGKLIPINVDNALQRVGSDDATIAWLPWPGTIWVDESKEAVASGIVSRDAFERLHISPAYMRAGLWWMTAVIAFTTLLLASSMFAAYNAYRYREQTIVANNQKDIAIEQKERAETQRRRAQSRWLAMQALGTRSDQPSLALLLSVAAVKLDDSDVSRRAIIEQLSALPRSYVSLWSAPRWTRDLAFSGDGSTIVAVGTDGEVVKWRTSDIKQTGKRFVRHKGEVRSISFFHGLQAVTIGDDDRKLIHWNFAYDNPYESELPLAEHKPPLAEGKPMAIAAHPSNGTVAVAYYEKALGLIDMYTSRRVWDSGIRAVDATEGPFSAATFSPDGKFMATASSSGHVRILTTQGLRQSGKVLMGYSAVHAIAFSTDSKHLAVAGGNGVISVFEVRDDGNATKQYDLEGHTGDVLRLAFLPDGKTLVSASRDNTVRFWSTILKREVPDVKPLEQIGVSAMAFDSTGRWLVTGGINGDVRLWNLKSRTGIGDVIDEGVPFLTAMKLNEQAGAVVVGTIDGQVRAYRLADTKPITEWIKVADGQVKFVDRRPEGGSITTIMDSGIVCNSEQTPTTSFQCRPLFDVRNSGQIMGVSERGDGAALVSPDGVLHLTYVEDSAEQRPFEQRVNPTANVSFSRDGTSVAAICGQASTEICVLRRAPGAKIHRFPAGGSASSIALNADGSAFAVGTWDGRAFPPRPISSSPAPEDALLGHRGPVQLLELNIDGSLLASGAYDEPAIRIWPVSSKQLNHKLSLSGHSGGVGIMRFDNTSQRLFSYARDQNLIVWDLSESKWLDKACEIANRKLTDEEWNRWVGEGDRQSVCPASTDIPP